MFEIKIKGRSRNNKEIKVACQFFCDQLLGKRLSKNITININLIKNLGSPDYLGECEPLENTKLRKFQICINSSQSHKNIISTLAHECEHLRQFARGELSNRQYPIMKFYGVAYTEEEGRYCPIPYEVAASAVEAKLYPLWLKYKKTLPK